MLKLTKTGIGLLTRQYRSVLKKCWAINVGIFALGAAIFPTTVEAYEPSWSIFSNEGSGVNWGVFGENQENYLLNYQLNSDHYNGDHGSIAFAISTDPNVDGDRTHVNMQIDGYFYQSTGRYRVLDTSDIIDSVTSGSEKVVTSGAVYSALSGYATKATTLSGYGITDAYTKTQVDNLISQAGGSSVDLSDYYTKSEVYNKTEIDDIQSLNNYYRKNKKSGILNGFEAGKIGNENDDNFSKSVQNIKAVNDNFVAKNGGFVLNNGDFASKNPSRLGAFSKCGKACPRPSERKGVTANSAFEFNRQNVASTDAGTTLNNRQQFKVVMDNLSQCHADNGDFASNNLSRLGAFSKCEKACSRPSERFPASLEKNSAFEQYSRSARGTFLFVSQTHKNVLDNFSKLAANDNFATTTFLRAI